MILLLAVTAYPLAYNLWNSFHAENLSVRRARAASSGVDNYTQMFKSSEWVAGARARRVRRGLGRDRDGAALGWR